MYKWFYFAQSEKVELKGCNSNFYVNYIFAHNSLLQLYIAV